MREILFKAKREDNGEWVEGFYVNAKEEYGHGVRVAEIITIDAEQICSGQYSHMDSFPVEKETLCQYTGLTDKNGNKIWENDVVFVTDDNGCSGQVDTGIGEIDFLEGLWYISGSVQNALYDINKCFQIEVIGNIFDNPELLSKTEFK